VGVELGENGKTDFVGKVGANVNVAGQTVAGVEVRAGVLSGPSVSGAGMLSGIDK
jgi:non-ribosomal peptide synthetase component E (peptide arylation enzyme)